MRLSYFVMQGNRFFLVITFLTSYVHGTDNILPKSTCGAVFKKNAYIALVREKNTRLQELLGEIKQIKSKTLELKNKIHELNDKWEAFDHNGRQTKQEEIAKIMSVLENQKLPIIKEIEKLELEWVFREKFEILSGHQARLARSLSKLKKELKEVDKDLKNLGYFE